MLLRYSLDPKYRHYKKDSRFISDLYTITYDTSEGGSSAKDENARRSDREEIRRRLALESDDLIEKPAGRKPSLQSRLQSSMNLQICFMNETASDSESPNSDTESKNQQPASLPYVKAQSGDLVFGGRTIHSSSGSTEDFQTKQSRLQVEARQALSQAKEMARMQMAQEKDQRLSPITDMLRNSLEKVGIQLQPERRRLTRQLLTEMNVTQLQVIVNDLHSHIEMLNESLVSLLLERDDLHMEQDSMLVDIEDLTRYLAAKDNSPHQSLPVMSARSYLGKN